VRRERALDIAQRQTNQLTRLVDDLLDVARITQGRIRLHRRSVSVASMLERVLESTRAAIEERSHTVTLMLREDVLVDADPTRLEQIVVNLVCNAVKYTEPGGTIEIACERSGDEAVLRVRDDGIGIAPHMLGHVFDLFTQAERTLDRAQGGLGIGLTLVRRLTELHGGRVEARSDGLGKGAEFVVYVPAAAAAEPSGDSPRAPVQHATARVLLVEDNPDAAETLRMLLELLGHRVNVVHDGLSALAAAESNLPDVMLIDIGLPGMDGYELARQVRGKPALASIMLIALTGYGRDEDRDRATSVGFNYHLVKPVELDVLRSLVARADRRRLTVH
jgi:two-component system CheB/CheR fusion protein